MSFTMAEYIEKNALGVSMKDTGATKMIAKHLIELGYKKFKKSEKGKTVYLWTKDAIPVRPDRKELADRLAGLKEMAGGGM